jgi:hypothetical protein
MRVIYILLFCALSVGAHGASIYKKALDKKTSAYLEDGVVIGGRAGHAYSLINIRRDLSPKLGMERVILDLGDIEGRPLKGGVSYFQASIEKNPPRVVIDLAQVNRSAVTEAKLKRAFQNSPYIKNVELTADPEDRSANIVLALKDAMDVEVFEMPATNRASRIVVDLKSHAKKGTEAK